MLRYLHDDITGTSEVDARVRSDIATEEAAEKVADRVVRVLWESEIAPIDFVFVVVESDDYFDTLGPYNFTEADDASQDNPELAERWGPRPTPEGPK